MVVIMAYDNFLCDDEKKWLINRLVSKSPKKEIVAINIHVHIFYVYAMLFVVHSVNKL